LNESGDLRQILRRYKVNHFTLRSVIIIRGQCVFKNKYLLFYFFLVVDLKSALDRKPSAIRAAATATCRVPSVPALRNPSTATTSPPSLRLSSASPATKRVSSAASLVHPLRPLDPPASLQFTPHKRRIRKNPTNKKQTGNLFLSLSLSSLPIFISYFSFFHLIIFPHKKEKFIHLNFVGRFLHSQVIHFYITRLFFIAYNNIIWSFSVCPNGFHFECNSLPIERQQDVKSCWRLYIVVLYYLHSV
jgi:hypothetical protein